MKMLTVDQIMSWRPCGKYTRKRVAELWAGRESLSPLEVLQLDIPVVDRFWVVLRQGVIGDVTLRLWAADCAEHVLHLFESRHPDDKRPRLAVAAARAYACGVISFDEVAAARAAAWDAGWDAARDGARDAAWAAVRAAAGDGARDAAWAAARAAEWDGAWAAAWDAARDGARAAAASPARAAARAAARQWQVERLCAYLCGEIK